MTHTPRKSPKQPGWDSSGQSWRQKKRMSLLSIWKTLLPVHTQCIHMGSSMTRTLKVKADLPFLLSLFFSISPGVANVRAKSWSKYLLFWPLTSEDFRSPSHKPISNCNWWLKPGTSSFLKTFATNLWRLGWIQHWNRLGGSFFPLNYFPELLVTGVFSFLLSTSSLLNRQSSCKSMFFFLFISV